MKRCVVYILIFSMGNLPTCVGKSRKLRKRNFSRVLDGQVDSNNQFSQHEEILEFAGGKHHGKKKKKLNFFRKAFSFRKRKKV